MYVKKAAETTFVRKNCTYKVDEIDGSKHIGEIPFWGRFDQNLQVNNKN